MRLVDLVGYWQGLPPSVAIESGALLYQRTGQKRYRDFSERIAAQWNEPGKVAPKGLRLVEDALAGKPARDIGSPKAYEQLYCFIGICELYRATGNRKYLDAAIALAKNVREDELFVTGTGSQEELWFHGKMKQTGVVHLPAETCVTAHWMHFCWQLLRLTGDPAYADEMETSLYNALFGRVNARRPLVGLPQFADGRTGAKLGRPNRCRLELLRGQREPGSDAHALLGRDAGRRGARVESVFSRQGRGKNGFRRQSARRNGNRLSPGRSGAADDQARPARNLYAQPADPRLEPGNRAEGERPACGRAAGDVCQDSTPMDRRRSGATDLGYACAGAGCTGRKGASRRATRADRAGAG